MYELEWIMGWDGVKSLTSSRRSSSDLLGSMIDEGLLEQGWARGSAAGTVPSGAVQVLGTGGDDISLVVRLVCVKFFLVQMDTSFGDDPTKKRECRSVS